MNNNRGERIRNLCSHLSLSLVAFGEPINISTTHVSRIEKGTVEASDFAMRMNTIKCLMLVTSYGDGHACERITDILEGKEYQPWVAKIE